MSEIVAKIAEFLQANPSSRAKIIATALGEEKSVINKHLYANEHALFSKEGLTPPLWRCIAKDSI